jgi:hypothetical protein
MYVCACAYFDKMRRNYSYKSKPGIKYFTCVPLDG